jgi:hypothetical protein
LGGGGGYTVHYLLNVLRERVDSLFALSTIVCTKYTIIVKCTKDNVIIGTN